MKRGQGVCSDSQTKSQARPQWRCICRRGEHSKKCEELHHKYFEADPTKLYCSYVKLPSPHGKEYNGRATNEEKKKRARKWFARKVTLQRLGVSEEDIKKVADPRVCLHHFDRFLLGAMISDGRWSPGPGGKQFPWGDSVSDLVVNTKQERSKVVGLEYLTADQLCQQLKIEVSEILPELKKLGVQWSDIKEEMVIYPNVLPDNSIHEKWLDAAEEAKKKKAVDPPSSSSSSSSTQYSSSERSSNMYQKKRKTSEQPEGIIEFFVRSTNGTTSGANSKYFDSATDGDEVKRKMVSEMERDCYRAGPLEVVEVVLLLSFDDNCGNQKFNNSLSSLTSLLREDVTGTARIESNAAVDLALSRPLPSSSSKRSSNMCELGGDGKPLIKRRKTSEQPEGIINGMTRGADINYLGSAKDGDELKKKKESKIVTKMESGCCRGAVETLYETLASVKKRKDEIQPKYEQELQALKAKMEADVKQCDEEMLALESVMQKEKVEGAKRHQLWRRSNPQIPRGNLPPMGFLAATGTAGPLNRNPKNITASTQH